MNRRWAQTIPTWHAAARRWPTPAAQGKNDEAESCCKQAISILEKAPPAADPVSYAKALEEYAKVLRNTNRAAEAGKVEARAKALREGPAKTQ